jgi:hypothetical protein
MGNEIKKMNTLILTKKTTARASQRDNSHHATPHKKKEKKHANHRAETHIKLVSTPRITTHLPLSRTG